MDDLEIKLAKQYYLERQRIIELIDNGYIFQFNDTGMIDKDSIYKNTQLRCQLDGNALCITAPGFINLQESEAVFIDLTDSQVKEVKELYVNEEALTQTEDISQESK